MANPIKIVVPKTNEILEEVLTKSLNIDPIIIRLLYNRGLVAPQDINSFLQPSKKDLLSPALFNGIREVANRVLLAVHNDENILIYGDYDVDGITGTALLKTFLFGIGSKNVHSFIPNRCKEGYGIHTESLKSEISKNNIKLIISVDCGISAIEAVDMANTLDVDCIITDHHIADSCLPKAYGIINPKIPNSGYPFTELAGVGVAFKLCQAVQHAINGDYWSPSLESLLVFVALGTIADLVPLRGENRILVKLGLEKINEKPSLGLKALIDTCKIRDPINAGHIGFVIAPRLNAAGRLVDADLALELLLTEDQNRAQEIAQSLDQLNSERQAIEQSVVEEAQVLFENQTDKLILVGHSANWHPGVIGIAASRLVARFNRPIFLISTEGDIGKGSGRSINNFDLYKSLEYSSSYLQAYGGHKMAAGITISSNSISDFDNMINNYAQTHLSQELLIPSSKIDTEMGINDLNFELVKEIEKFAPFGIGNPSPVFYHQDLLLETIKKAGKNKDHLIFSLLEKESEKVIKGVAFKKGDRFGELVPGSQYSTIYSPLKNLWGNQKSLELNIHEIASKDEVFFDYNEREDNSSNSFGLPAENITYFQNRLTMLEEATRLLLENQSKGLYVLPNSNWQGIVTKELSNLPLAQEIHLELVNGLESPLNIASILELLNSSKPSLIITTLAFALKYIDKLPKINLLLGENPFLDFPTEIYYNGLSKLTPHCNNLFFSCSKTCQETNSKTNISEKYLPSANINFSIIQSREEQNDLLCTCKEELIYISSEFAGQKLKIKYPNLNLIYPDNPLETMPSSRLIFYELPSNGAIFATILANFTPKEVLIFTGNNNSQSFLGIINKKILAEVYLYLKEKLSFESWSSFSHIKNSYPSDKNIFIASCKIFSELNMIKTQGERDNRQIYLCKPHGIMDLFDSIVYNELINEGIGTMYWQTIISSPDFSNTLQRAF